MTDGLKAIVQLFPEQVGIFFSFPNDNNLKSKEQNKKDKNFTSTK